ncbi:MAG: PQQ-binding-like beta-propeller repeat protein [Endomicrobiia bacterium]
MNKKEFKPINRQLQKIIGANIFFIMLISIVYPASWRAFRNNPQRTGSITETALTPFELKWIYQIQGRFTTSSPITYKSYVYCGSEDGSIWCWDIYTGELQWQYSTEGRIDSTPVAYKNKIFVASTDGKIYALKYLYNDDEDVQPLWAYDTGSKLRSSPIVVNDRLYILTGHPSGEIIVIDTNTGHKITNYNIPSFSFSSPAVKDNYLVLGTHNGKYYCIDLNTGKEKWSKQTITNVEYITPVISDENRVYVVNKGQKSEIYCIDLVSGSEIWVSTDIDKLLSSGKNTYTTSSSGGLYNDKFYVCYGYNVSQFIDKLKLVSIDKNNGNILYISTDIGSPHNSGNISSPAIGQSLVFIGSGDGNLYILDSSTLGVVAKYQSEGAILAQPCISNGWLFFGDTYGNFYAYKSSNVVSIVSPDTDDMVYGIVSITGTVKHTDLSDYIVQYATSSNGEWIEISTGTASKENEFLCQWNTTSTIDGTYFLKLTMNISGGTSYFAMNSVGVNNPPLAPESLVAKYETSGDQQYIKLTWEKSSDDGSRSNDVIQYRIYRTTISGKYSSTPDIVVSSGNIVAIDFPLVFNVTYYYVVRAYDGLWESENSPEASSLAVDTIKPSQPVNLWYTISKGKIKLIWGKSSDDGSGANDVSQYWIYRSTTQGKYNDIHGVVSKGETEYIDNSSESNITYYYIVVAVDKYGNISEPSNEIYARYIEHIVDNLSSQIVKFETKTGQFVEVYFEPGSTNQKDKLTIAEIKTDFYEGVGSNFLDTAYEFKFESHSTKLTKLVTLRLPYTDQEIISKGFNERLLRIFWYDDEKGIWKMVNNSVPNESQNYVEVKINRFSIYGLGTYQYHGKLLEESEVYTYPNPAKATDKIHFKFRIYDVFNSIDIKISVYTISQQLVWQKTLSYNETSAGNVKDIVWNISKIASGVYIYRIEAESGDYKKTITKKLAIIQ